MSDLLSNPPRFGVGSVMLRSASILAQRFIPFMFLTLLIVCPPYLYLLVTEGAAYIELPPIAQFFASLLSVIAIAALVYGTSHALRGQRIGIGATIVGGLRQVVPVLVVSLITWIAIAIGTVLLIIPGLIVATVLWVAVPAAVIERPGIMASLQRSRELTRGYRWRVFGLTIVALIVMFVPVLIVAIISIWIGFQGVLVGLLQWIMSAVIVAVASVVGTVAYYQLRLVKEGLEPEQVAAVFD